MLKEDMNVVFFTVEGRGADWGPDLQAAGTAPSTASGKVLGWGAAGAAVCVNVAGHA